MLWLIKRTDADMSIGSFTWLAARMQRCVLQQQSHFPLSPDFDLSLKLDRDTLRTVARRIALQQVTIHELLDTIDILVRMAHDAPEKKVTNGDGRH